MIERKFTSQRFKEFRVKQHVRDSLSRVGLSSVKLQKTSLGERVVVTASRPGLVVGRGGATIQRLTSELKNEFKLENPQIEIEEIKDFSLDAAVVAESIVNQLERFGTQKFKGIGHKSLDQVMKAGALGVEILISGRIPSSRAKTWRFADGYMKKCGDIAITGVDTAKQFACLKVGVVGVQVRIMPQTTKLPDRIAFKEDLAAPVVEETKSELAQETQEVEKANESENKETKEAKPKATKKKTSKSKDKAEAKK